MKRIFYILTTLTLLTLVACTGPDRTSRYENGEEAFGGWSEKDGDLVAQQLITELTSSPWLSKAITKLQEKDEGATKPRIVIGKFRNQTAEHINMDHFIRNFRNALINAEQINFVSRKNMRKDVIEELEHQITHASEESANDLGEGIAADYMLFVTLTEIENRKGSTTFKFYQADAELHSIQTREIVWVGQKKIRKKINQRRYGW